MHQRQHTCTRATAAAIVVMLLVTLMMMLLQVHHVAAYVVRGRACTNGCYNGCVEFWSFATSGAYCINPTGTYMHILCDSDKHDSHWRVDLMTSSNCLQAHGEPALGESGDCAMASYYGQRAWFMIDCTNTWICPRDHYCEAEAIPVACGGIGRTSLPGRRKELDCRCRAGWRQINNITDSALCEICPINSWCHETQIFACGTNRTSPMESSLSTSCRCITPLQGDRGVDLPCNLCEAGSYCPSGDAIPCPIGSFCPSESIEPISCGGNQTTVIGSTNVTACHCGDGWYNVGPSTCYECPIGSFCRGGNRTLCSDNGFSVTPPRASLSTQCRCALGYYGADGPGEQCAICPAGYRCQYASITPCGPNAFCPEGSVNAIQCEGHQRHAPAMSTFITDCVCFSSFYGALDNTPCIWCPVGFYCNSANGTLTTACPVHTTTIWVGGNSIDSCLCEDSYYGPRDNCTICPIGYWCRSANLYPCTVGDYCPSGSSWPTWCPSTRTSAGLAGKLADCTCQPGYWATLATLDTPHGCTTCAIGKWCDGFANEPLSCSLHAATINSRQKAVTDCICIAGYWGAIMNTTSNCTQCQLGDLCPVNTRVPTLCPIGYYCLNVTTSEQCPPHSTSVARSTSINDCYCVAPYHGPNGGPCINDTLSNSSSSSSSGTNDDSSTESISSTSTFADSSSSSSSSVSSSSTASVSSSSSSITSDVSSSSSSSTSIDSSSSSGGHNSDSDSDSSTSTSDSSSSESSSSSSISLPSSSLSSSIVASTSSGSSSGSSSISASSGDSVITSISTGSTASSSGMITGEELSDDSSSSTSDMIIDIIPGSTGGISSVMIGIIIGSAIIFVATMASVIYSRRRYRRHDLLLATSSSPRCSCSCLGGSTSRASDSSNATIIINNSDHVPVTTLGHTNDDHIELLPHIGNSEL